MRLIRRLNAEEAGQAFILMILATTLVFMVGVLVVDFGFWFNARASLVNATDQASMSASLKLPDDGAGAQADAIAYLQANNPTVDVSDIDITFRCVVGDRNHNNLPDTGDVSAICPQLAGSISPPFQCIDGLCYHDCEFNSANAKCNTIVVAGSGEVPFQFAESFGITSGNIAGFTSASCRGSCGSSPTLPLDVVLVIDRTTSMTSTDLANAKNAALTVLQLFDPQQQHVALAVINPSQTGTTCSGANSPALGVADSSGGGTFLPLSDFSSDYNDGDGNLNPNSLIVKTVNCLTQSCSNFCTNIGDPLKAATDLLTNSGRPGVKKGIILMTDGAANGPNAPSTSASTGYQPCTGQQAASGGDNNGYESPAPQTVARLCTDGSGAGADANSGSGTSTTNCATNNQKDRHRFFNFNLPALPAGAIVDGVEVKVDAWADSLTGSPTLCGRLTWNNGTSWSNTQQLASGLAITEQTRFLGGSDQTWGHSWNPASDFTNANFGVEITDVASNISRIFNLDTVQVNVYYHTPDPNWKGPCNYAAEKAQAAVDADIEIFTIGYGVANDTCVSVTHNNGTEQTNSPYEDELTTKFLAALGDGSFSFDDGGDGFGGLPGGCTSSLAISSENADGDHFLCEARGADLTAVFKAAAEALAGGSRLIKLPPGQ